MFINALGIAEGTETAPTVPATPTDEDKRKLDDWHKQLHQGLSLLLVSFTSSVHQSLDMKKTLDQSWSTLKANYGMHISLTLWVDYRKYTPTTFSPNIPLTQQINKMSELKNHIVAAGLNISDPLHTLNVLQALPASYEIVQQTIPVTITDFTTINWANI